MVSWSPGPDVVVRIVTEDSAPDAHETVSHLLRRMLQLVEPTFATNRLKTLRQEDADERQAAQPHRWHSRDSRDRLFVKKLARTIATDLLASRFVLVHADGDVKWSERPGRNAKDFEESLMPVVRAALAPEHTLPRSPRQIAPARSTRTEEEIGRYLGRMVLVMPYYTIEAWLYQNTDVAIRLCQEKYQGRDVQTFLDWQKDRARLDDEVEALDVCLRKRHNLELASSSYPSQQVHDANASFHGAVEALRACTDLRGALSHPVTRT
jgi:hypothetical protein